MSMNKPKFNPNQPFDVAKPKFDPSQPFQGKDQDISELESGLRGLAQGASFGFSDEITGAIESALSNKSYEQARNESRAAYKDAEEANPISYNAGNIGGAAATAFIPGLGEMNIAKAAALGGVSGLGASSEDSVGGQLIDTAKGAGIGAAVGKIADIASPYVSKGISKLSSSANDTAERLAARSLGAERGTIKKLGQDKVQELGRYALDEGLITPLSSTDDIIERNLAKKAAGSSKMNEVYSAIDDAGKSSFNPLEVATKVDEKIGDFYRSPINRGETNQLENTLESILMRGEGNIPLSEAQILKQELGKVANWKNNINITDKERMARDAYGIVSSHIDDAVESGAKEIGSDGLLETLKQGKQLYGNAKGADELLTNKLAREQGNKLFGLTDSIATGSAATAVGPTGLLAFPAKKVIESYGPQSAAIALDKVSKALLKSPQMSAVYKSNPMLFQKIASKFESSLFGQPMAAETPENSAEQKAPIEKNDLIQRTQGSRYSKLLQDAAARGDQSFNAAHFVLSRRDPEYRKQIGASEK